MTLRQHYELYDGDTIAEDIGAAIARIEEDFDVNLLYDQEGQGGNYNNIVYLSRDNGITYTKQILNVTDEEIGYDTDLEEYFYNKLKEYFSPTSDANESLDDPIDEDELNQKAEQIIMDGTLEKALRELSQCKTKKEQNAFCAKFLQNPANERAIEIMRRYIDDQI